MIPPALGLVGEELRGDLVELAARGDDESGVAETEEQFVYVGSRHAGAFGDLGIQERGAIGKSAQDFPSVNVSQDSKQWFDRERCGWI